jgi:uncharacterized membrane protein
MEVLMESRVKLLGHPVHPMLVVLPLALFAVAVVFDVVYLLTGDPVFAQIAFWNIGVGIVGGLLAALAGVVDWLAIPKDTRAKRLGAWHGLGNLVIVFLFAASWLLRLGEPAYGSNILPVVPAVVAVGLALVTAWLGGELVYRLGIGVDREARGATPTPIDAPRGVKDQARRPA